MKRTNKKGFTIVELVIVVAVIAILAAVLIPTFGGIIEKANLAKDQQMVNYMNQELAIEDALNDFEHAGDAINALAAYGFYGDKLAPFTKGYHYAYSLEKNTMYVIDDECNIIFPEANGVAASSLWALYGDSDTYYVEGITKYVATTSVLNQAHFSAKFVNGETIDLAGNVCYVNNTAAGKTVTLINGTVSAEATGFNATGATALAVKEASSFSSGDTVEDSVVKLSEIKAINDGITIKGSVIDLSGLPANTSGMSLGGTVVIEDCTFIGVGKWALELSVGADITVKNCTFNCSRGINLVGKYIGNSSSANVTIEGNTFNLTDSKKGAAVQLGDFTGVADSTLSVISINMKNNTINGVAGVMINETSSSLDSTAVANMFSFSGNTLGEGVEAAIVDPGCDGLNNIDAIVSAIKAKFN